MPLNSLKDLSFRVKNVFTYRLERLLIRGTMYRLLIIAASLAFISFATGILMYFASVDFRSIPEASWWAFLRLSDPGYLGDDQGAFKRTVATVVTVLGYVLFMGSLVAIMTQWLNTMLARLDRGETPIYKKNHILILGWTERVPVIVREILLSQGRIKRFLELSGQSKLEIVLLADGDSSIFQSELRTSLGALWNERRITIRSGQAVRLAHLNRAAFAKAAVIIIPGSDFSEGSELDRDISAVKTLLTASGSDTLGRRATPPRAVIEMKELDKEGIAKSVYGDNAQTINGLQFISRLIVQNIHHRGLSHVYSQLFSSKGGQSLFVRELSSAVGKTVGELKPSLTMSIFVGLVRKEDKLSITPILCPPEDQVILENDQVVALAGKFEDISPEALKAGAGDEDFVPTMEKLDPSYPKKILIMGWSSKISFFLSELSRYSSQKYEITILSNMSLEQRSSFIEADSTLPNLSIHHLIGDYTSKAVLLRTGFQDYDSIIILASNWLTSRQDADARTLIGYLHLKNLAAEQGVKPHVLVELLDSTNMPLVDPQFAEILPSGLLVGHILAQISLRPELLSIFESLFGPGGPEMRLIPISHYQSEQEEELLFSVIGTRANKRGEIILGVLQQGEANQASLNPPGDSVWKISDNYTVIVVSE